MKFSVFKIVVLFAAIGMAAPTNAVFERSTVADGAAEAAPETMLLKRQWCGACSGGKYTCSYC